MNAALSVLAANPAPVLCCLINTNAKAAGGGKKRRKKNVVYMLVISLLRSDARCGPAARAPKVSARERSDVAVHIYSSALRPQHTVAGMMGCFTVFAKTRYRLCKGAQRRGSPQPLKPLIKKQIHSIFHANHNISCQAGYTWRAVNDAQHLINSF